MRSASGGEQTSFDQPSAFAAALRQAMSEARDIELLFAIWEQNVETVRALNRSLKQDSLLRSGIAPQLVAHLKHCAVALVKPEKRSTESETTSDQQILNGAGSKIDKSVLTLSEPKRIRSKEHLHYVAQQPCLVCGRAPATPITSASHNPGALGSRSVTNSPCRSAPFTISRTTQAAMSGYGGRSTRSIRSQWPHGCGEKASTCERPSIRTRGRLAHEAESSSWWSRDSKTGKPTTSAIDKRCGAGSIPVIFEQEAGACERVPVQSP